MLSMRNGLLPAMSVNKGCHSHQRLQPQPKVTWWAPRELRKEKNTCHLAAIRLQPRPRLSPEETPMWKHWILALESWGAYQRNDFSEPRFLHLPMHRKVLNSLTWDIWFSSIYNNLLTFRLPALRCKTPIRPGPYLGSSEQFSQGYLRCCLPGLKS